jgi:hypothetical protein
MAPRFQPFTLGTRTNMSTPLAQRVRVTNAPRTRAAAAAGRNYHTNSANPTAPAGSNPRNVDLLTKLDNNASVGKGR